MKEAVEESGKVAAARKAGKIKMPLICCLLFVDDTFKDALDTVWFQFLPQTNPINHVYCSKLVSLDHLDGGFSLLVRVPGTFPSNPDSLKVDCYIPPHEMRDSTTEQHVRVMIQYFIENITIRHLQVLKERFANSNLAKPTFAGLINASLPEFPSPVARGGCRYQYIHNMDERTVNL